MNIANKADNQSGINTHQKSKKSKVKGLSNNLLQIVADQIAILATTVTKETLHQNYEKIHYLCASHNPFVYKNYFLQLVLYSSIALHETQFKYSLQSVVDLLALELNYIASNLQLASVFKTGIERLLEEVDLFSLNTLFAACHCDIFQQTVFSILVEDVKFESFQKETKDVLAKLTPKLVVILQDPKYTQHNLEKASNLSSFLHHYFGSKTVTLTQKLIVANYIYKRFAGSQGLPNAVQTQINKLFAHLSEMSIKEILLQTNPELITLDHISNTLSVIQDQSKINDAVSLVLAEILVPKSQEISNTPGSVTSLAALSIADSFVKGNQLRTIITSLKAQPDWNDVLKLLVSSLNQLSLPSLNLVSLNQFFVSLPSDEIIDLFLQQELSMPIRVALYFTLHRYNTECYQLKNLTSVFINTPYLTPNLLTNLANNIIRFVNVAKLYLDVVFASETDSAITKLFNEDVKHYAECLVFTILNSKITKGTADLLNNLLFMWILEMSPFLPAALKKYSEVAANEFLVFLSEFFKENKTAAAVIPYLLQTSILDTVLNTAARSTINFHIWLKYAIKAVYHGWKNLVPIIRSYFNANPQLKNEAFTQILIFLLSEAKNEYDYSQSGQFDPSHNSLSLVLVYELLQFIGEQEQLNPQQLAEVRAVQKQCLLAYPRLINFGYGHDKAILANVVSLSPNTFPMAVEQQMKEYYQRMYNNTVEITEIVRMLQSLKESNVPYEQDVFACMIHSLLDEYRFFREYPIDALQKTSILFGSLINYRLIDGVTLSLALSFILESARENPDSNMFKFAVQALISARPRLPEFPKYCEALYGIQGLRLQPKIYQVIERSVRGEPTASPVARGESVAAPKPSAAKEALFKAINPNIDFIQNVPQEDPQEESSDKILFIVNNITSENLSTRVTAIKQALSERNYEWFSKYIVASRAKSEPNYQDLYCALIDAIGSPLLEQYVLEVTYLQINRLLTHNTESVNERSYLKNLGAWLGKITLGRDKPILRENLSFKDLLIEGYVLDKMSLTIPFVCKVLDQAVLSKIFKPPNPWTMGIIELLIELYKTTSLKLQLRFEIEVLLNALLLKIDDIEESSILKDKSNEQLTQLVSDHLLSGLDLLQRLEEPAVLSQQAQFKLRQQIPLPQPIRPQQVSATDNLALMLENFVNGLSGKAFYQLHPNVKRLFQLAFNKAIREVLPPAVDRAVSISVNTAHTLVLKDFALEGDENKLRRAAANTVRGVSQYLAKVFSRDLLLKHVGESVTSSLGQNFVASDPAVIEQMLLQVINDNIEGACQIIEIAAMEKATAEMDEALLTPIYARRQHKLDAPGQPYVSPNISKYAIFLPQPLGLMPGGVTTEQLQVYENIGRLTMTTPQVRRMPTAEPEQFQQPLVKDIPQARPAAEELEPNAAQAMFVQSVTYLQQLLETLLKALADSQDGRLSELPTDHAVKTVLVQILSICAKNLTPAGDEIYVKVAQFTVNALFTTAKTTLSRETLVYLLNKLCELSPSTAKDASWWLVHAEDDRKYNAKIMSTLLKVGLIVPSDLDVSLSKAIVSKNDAAIKFASEMINDTLFVDGPFCLRTDFASTIGTLNKLVKSGEIKDKSSIEFIEKLKNTTAPIAKPDGSKKVSLSSQMGYIFVEWIRLLQHSNLDDKLLYVFVYQLASKGVLSKPENMSVFFRTAVEISVASFLEDGFPYSRNEDNDVFVGVDALSKLIIKVIIAQGNDTQQKITYLRQILTIVTLVFTKDHEKNLQSFNERPYYRIFSTLLSEWSDVRLKIEDMEDGAEKDQLMDLDQSFYLLMADFLSIYQPLAYPGFTFAWITLISHRMFLPNILELHNQVGWKKLSILLVSVLRFTAANIKGKNIPAIITVIYRGLVRIFSLIQHDYPEFFIEYHYPLSYTIPASFIQLKNIVLSSFPKTATLPDPFQNGLKVEKISGITDAPPIAINPGNDILKAGIKKPVDNYLRIPSQSAFKSILSAVKLTDPIDQGGIGFETTTVDAKIINALVLYTGINVIEERRDNTADFNPKSSHVSLLSSLLQDDSVELQYQVLSAIVNQLRYPNAHTNWFSCVIIYFFSSSSLWGSKKLVIQQVITRVLLERLIVHRPHPWGVTITLIELLTNSAYGFFDLQFTKEIPELEKLFNVLLKHVASPSAE